MNSKTRIIYIRAYFVVILIILLGLSAVVANHFLKKNYAEAFESEEDEKYNKILYCAKDESYSYQIKDDGTISLINYQWTDKEVVYIPEEIDGYKVTEIGGAAFSYHEEIKEIYVPDSIKIIRLASFGDCNTLEAIFFEGDVDEIEEYAFVGFNGVIYAEKNTNVYDYAEKEGLEIRSAHAGQENTDYR